MSIPGSASPLFFQTAAAADAAAFKVERSLRFNSSDSAYLSFTPSSAGNRRTFTFSCWVKRNKVGHYSGLFGGADGSNTQGIYLTNADEIYVPIGGQNHIWSPKIRDLSAWYHIVTAVDTTQSTNTDRIKTYINGVALTTSEVKSAGWPSQNVQSSVSNTGLHTIGRNAGNTGSYGEYYLAEVHFIDGQALAATDFGEEDSNGVWQPKEYSGTYGEKHNGGWVSDTTGTAYNASVGIEKAFDGSTSTLAAASSGGTLTFTPSTAITGITKVRIHAQRDSSASSATITLNGTNISSNWSNGDDKTVEITTDNLTSLAWTTQSNGQWFGVRKIEIYYNGSYQTLASNNSFYLKFADNSSNSALGTDSSGNGNTWTVNNLAASGSSSVSVIDLDGNDSIEYPGPGDGISGDFTMECFFLMDSSASGYQRIFSTKEGSYSDEQTMIRRHDNGNIQFYAGNSSPADHLGGSITTGVWHHAAIVRSSGTISYYYDGSRLSTDSYSTSFDITKLVVGGGYGSENFNGDVHGARFTLGQALYTGSSYTVPTSGITTTSQGATASNVKVLAGTTSTVNANAGTLGDGSNSGDPTATTAAVFGTAGGMDSLLDTPTNYTASSGNNGGNYATFASLAIAGRGCTFSNGNLDVVVGSGYGGTNNDGIRACSSIGMTSGKYYFEHEITGGSVARSNVGVVSTLHINGWGGNHWIGSRSTDYIVWSLNGTKYNSGSQSSYGVSWTTGDIIGCAFDADAGNLYIYKNGTVMNSGTPAFTGLTSGPYFFICSERESNITANFGQRPFAYTPPTGYVSLCTQNLSESAYASVADGSTAFDISLWTGNGTSQTISGLNHSPDLVWTKARSFGADPEVYDIVRGTQKRLYSSLSNAENTPTSGVNSFNSDGFGVTGGGGVNNNNATYVGWTWDAGSSTSSNTDGSITSNVRASQTNGFSIVTWTAASNNVNTIGHGLNAAPEFIIAKSRTASNNWRVWTAVTGKDKYLGLNSSSGTSSFSNFWSTSEPTSSTFGVWNATGAANNDGNMVAYCFAPVEGFSAFGEYYGNGLADGPFIYTGFRVAFLVQKRTDSSGSWAVKDAAREPYNVVDTRLYWDASNSDMQQSSFHEVDFLSNGFKVRSPGGSEDNASNATFIYMAFAEHPFRTARAR